MTIESKAKEAIEVALQNMIDNKSEVEMAKGSFRTKSNTAGEIANLIAQAHKAGIDLKTASGTRTIGTRIG